ncbi:mechanosensitive ion channel domain-containing protein [Candidatus Lokiarchaeum ossiferum]|uniref:mechanosensitive ion channel domain-containing protein n=1 Tax=Candidatus Lokiarchaeum ossiferum TaxID=2951803 RepID=UPI00352E46B3
MTLLTQTSEDSPFFNPSKFFSEGPTWEILNLTIQVYAVVAILLGIVLILLFNFVLKVHFRKIINRHKLPPNTYNGIKFFLRIFSVTLTIWLILGILQIEGSFLWIIIGIFTTALTFASMKTINNFVAGIWIAINRPYIVGDYVKIGKTIGIVKNISTTYTQLIHNDATISYLPNLECLSSTILNYTWSLSLIQRQIYDLEKNLEKIIQIPEVNEKNIEENTKIQLVGQIKADIEEQKLILKEIEIFEEELEKADKDGERVKHDFSDYAQKGKIVNYVFNLELPKDFDGNEGKLTSICAKWSKEFNFRPQWDLVDITSHFVYQFTILTPDPLDIVYYLDDFVTDIYMSIYQV